MYQRLLREGCGRSAPLKRISLLRGAEAGAVAAEPVDFLWAGFSKRISRECPEKKKTKNTAWG
jgi:hypothetical protein